jgi:hypothetical protein
VAVAVVVALANQAVLVELVVVGLVELRHLLVHQFLEIMLYKTLVVEVEVPDQQQLELLE